MPQLEKLMEDEDQDVRFFATTAGKSWTGDAGAMET
jgi:serine/threonine-protein phosphatase 2A regulatory subunit A